MFNVKIISSTVRPGRKGPIIASWVAKVAGADPNFAVELIDLGQLRLPMMDEPKHPILQQYENEHTIRWSNTINSADAFIFVTAEYDFGYPSPLRNALEYLYHEWAYKAAGIVSYGGISGGTRGANSLKGDLATLKVVPLGDMVHIPHFTKSISAENVFIPDEYVKKATDAMLKELARWSRGLKAIREDKN